MDWGLYERSLTVYGNTDKERALNIAKEDFERDAVMNPGYRPDALRNGEPQRFLVDRTESSYKNKIIAFPGDELYVGDLVTLGDTTLIIQECRPLNELQTVGTGWICNLNLRWQNHTPDIIQRWAVLDSGVYSTTKTGNEMVQEPDKQFKLYLPFDEDTAKLFVDKRLAVDTRYDQQGDLILEVYKITALNRVARSYGIGGHLLILEVRSDEYSASRDNLEELICDYIAPSSDPTTDLSGLEIVGRDSVALSGSRKFTVQYDGDPALVTPVVWSVFPVLSGVTLNADGASAKLVVSDSAELVGAELTLTATCGASQYVATKKVEVVAP